MITQGKWKLLLNADDKFIVIVEGGSLKNPVCSRITHEADARLIAAAPELLAACKDGEKFLDCLLAGNGMSETQLRMMSENRMAFRRVLDEAIAKAEQT